MQHILYTCRMHVLYTDQGIPAIYAVLYFISHLHVLQFSGMCTGWKIWLHLAFIVASLKGYSTALSRVTCAPHIGNNEGFSPGSSIALGGGGGGGGAGAAPPPPPIAYEMPPPGSFCRRRPPPPPSRRQRSTHYVLRQT